MAPQCDVHVYTMYLLHIVFCRLYITKDRKRAKRMVCDCQFDPGILHVRLLSTYIHVCDAMIKLRRVLFIFMPAQI